MNTPDEHWWSIQAGEYVLGTLSSAEHELFEKMLAHDATLQKEVAYWEQRLAGLNETTEKVTPDSLVWQRILDAIRHGEHLTEQVEYGDSIQSQLISPLPVSEEVITSGAQHSTDRSALWKTLTGFSVAASLIMGFLVFQDNFNPRVKPFEADGLAVVLSDENSVPYFLVETDYRNSRIRVTALTPPDLTSTDVFQLWQAVPDRTSVRAIAQLPEEEGSTAIFDVTTLIDGSDLFGVSIESVDAPTEDGPLGPVVAHGDYLQTRQTD